MNGLRGSVSRSCRGASLAILILAAVGVNAAMAASPIRWEYPGRDVDGVPGPSEGLAIGEDGRLILSPPLREVFPGETGITAPPFVWSLALDMAGNLFFGTGNDGVVFRLDRKGASIPILDTSALGVRALSASVTGHVYVAGFPAGGVHRLDPAGASDPWFTLEERYVWAMVADRSDRVYLATGEHGAIYRVTGKGEGGVLFDSDEAHVTSLAITTAGELIAGTSPEGLVYRIASDGSATVVLDTDLREIAAIATSPDGAIYVAAIGEQRPAAVRRPGEKSEFTIEVTPAADGDLIDEPQATPRKISIDLADLLQPEAAGGSQGTAGRIYQVAPGQGPALLWSSDVDRVHALAFTRERGLVFGTAGGPSGGIYRLDSAGRATLLHRLREPGVTSLLAAPDGRIYVGTSNPGRVYLIDNGTLSGGTAFSRIHDAGGLTRWGIISWEADLPEGTMVDVSTRSGNRPSPDATWSEWSAAYPQPAGSAIVTPAGRYLQWRVILGRASGDVTPALRALSVTALPANTPPLVRSVRVLAPGKKASAASTALPTASISSGAPAQATAPSDPGKGLRWAEWTTQDHDGDLSRHTILVRGTGETEFRRLAEGAIASPWALDDSTLAEGRYVLRVEAADTQANGPERGLRGAAESMPFLVDRTPPTLEMRTTVRAPQVSGFLEILATDSPGSIERAEFSREGVGAAAHWTTLPCRDGICDTGSESFLLELAGGLAGQKVTVRVFDAAGNATTIEPEDAARKEGR